jgi:hypothetical protein
MYIHLLKIEKSSVAIATVSPYVDPPLPVGVTQKMHKLIKALASTVTVLTIYWKQPNSFPLSTLW